MSTQIMQEWVAKCKIERGVCEVCHYHEHACALHFHHWREKHFAISQGLRKPREVIIAEMQICTLLCANCHSVIHFDDDAPRCEVWKEMAAIKLQRGCAKCGYNEHSCALHFHHWGQKDFDISQSLQKPKDVLHAEVKKCTVLCARCHAVLHYCCETVWPKGYWKQYRGNVGGQDWRKVLDIGNSVVEGFAREPHLEIDIGNIVMEGILSEPPLRPEDGVDDPLLIFSTGDLAWQLGLIKSPKSFMGRYHG